MKTKLDKLIRFALLAPFVAALLIYGSTKPTPGPVFSFDNTYIGDGGSYATNDTVHVALTRRIMELPIDDCDVIAYMRERGSTNAADYVMLPTYKFGAYPTDFAVANATNYNYWFYLDYVPPSPVHTNGVFELRGFEVAGEPREPNPIFSAGFAQSAPKIAPPNASHYVQDGLIALWDGIENAGWGTHNPNATTWTNLAQDKWHLWVNPVVVWTDNAARKPTMDGFNIATNGPALTAAEEALARTVELVVTWTGEWQHTGNSYNKVAMLFNWGQAGNGGKTFFLSGTDGNRFSAQSRPASSTRYALSGPLSDIPVNQPFQLSADFAAKINARPTRFALNGVAVTNTTIIGRDGVAGITLGGPVAHHYYLLGDIHCVRVYDRDLTAEEKEHNLKIDKERFNLP